jgi:hypothetical protein
VQRDMDRMIDEVLEDEQLKQVKAPAVTCRC